MLAVRLMTNPVRCYDWGSPTAIARLQRRDPTGRPEAELWLGAHADAPSQTLRDGSAYCLRRWIEEDSAAVVGPQVLREFGPRLPFLLKVLAAEAPLSLQVHPDRAQAGAGFAAEEAAGVALDAPQRLYRDRSGKPELLCAMTTFHALCGFREPAHSAALLEELAVDRLRPLARRLRGPARDPLRTVVRALLTWPQEDRASLVEEVARAASRRSGAGRSGQFFGQFFGQFQEEHRWTVRLAERFPADPGVVCALLLNLVRLAPGEALFLSAGTPHAYLGGVGVEIMANSDNVLRGGLTRKHVDAGGLLDVLDTTASAPGVVLPRRLPTGEILYPAPAAEFRLTRVTPAPAHAVDLDRRGPQILLCTAGAVRAAADGARVHLARGQSAFVPAIAGPVRLSGDGTVFRATPGG
jgi:mannose-6-phosphate isomerase